MIARVVANGITYDGWEDISINASMDLASRAFAIKVTQAEQYVDLVAGDSVQIYLDNDLVLTGSIDKTILSYTAGSHDRLIGGRSKTSTAVESSYIGKSNQFKNQTVLQIAQALVKAFGITVIQNVTDEGPIELFELENDESALEAIHRVAQLRSLLVTDNELGQLVLTRIGNEQASTMLYKVPGDTNLLSVSVEHDESVRFSEVHVRTQKKGDDDSWGTSKQQIEAIAYDRNVLAYRPRIAVLRGDGTQKEAQDLANWMIADRLGDSIHVTCTVQGWRQNNNQLWKPNLRVQYRDQWARIDREMVIASCDYALTSSGTTTTLTLKLPEAYVPEPEIVISTNKRKQAKEANGGKAIYGGDVVFKK